MELAKFRDGEGSIDHTAAANELPEVVEPPGYGERPRKGIPRGVSALDMSTSLSIHQRRLRTRKRARGKLLAVKGLENVHRRSKGGGGFGEANQGGMGTKEAAVRAISHWNIRTAGVYGGVKIYIHTSYEDVPGRATETV